MDKNQRQKQPLYQEASTNRYTTQKPKRNTKDREVIDELPLQQADDYVDHYNVQMTKDMRVSKGSIRQLRKLGLKHHILGKTFPWHTAQEKEKKKIK